VDGRRSVPAPAVPDPELHPARPPSDAPRTPAPPDGDGSAKSANLKICTNILAMSISGFRSPGFFLDPLVRRSLTYQTNSLQPSVSMPILGCQSLLACGRVSAWALTEEFYPSERAMAGAGYRQRSAVDAVEDELAVGVFDGDTRPDALSA
jgi:hypothetical protein